ncbi:hypothetical protein NE237_009339 [Protea cynaroides]|uniref:RRM domain-containing protein n=1 Tax=Protea cynaroides TaxID=273540 RepID=A0A9Q0KXR8_9MAGN|nr:hypothetical protein NE237_009339 [Protea cynaroides]
MASGRPPPAQMHMNRNTQAQHFGYKGSEEALPKPQADEEVATTLLVRHLPEAIPHETLYRLFAHYGASSVRPCAGGRLRNCAFVDFKDETLASQAQSQLNRLRFLGKVLSVERASKQILNNKNQRNEPLAVEDLAFLHTSLQKDTPLAGNLTRSANADSLSVSEPIAARLGVDYPFPPLLAYAYPPPDGNILTNIVNALIAVPRFYTQVLHLMNKMNIPAPFRMALPIPPLPPSVAVALPPPLPPPPPVVAKPYVADLSSDESELESSEEGDGDDRNLSFMDSRIMKHGCKRARREAIVGPAIDKEVAHEVVGLKPSTLVPKEIPVIKKNNSVLKIKIASKPVQNEPKHDDENTESLEQAKEDLELKSYARPEEIERAKLPPEEILSLPMFKNYTAGNPSTVLYIKNLAKDVVPEDFYFIFGSLFGSLEEAKSGLNVKLMQEGRMRGQAFVTFPTVDLAHCALNLVNGYVFKSKPMIIQFGRNPAAGKAN